MRPWAHQRVDDSPDVAPTLAEVRGGRRMAKALAGHVGLGPDLRILAEVRRLQKRVRDLEREVCRLRVVNEELAAAAVDAELLLQVRVPAPQPEPALA